MIKRALEMFEESAVYHITTKSIVCMCVCVCVDSKHTYFAMVLLTYCLFFVLFNPFLSLSEPQLILTIDRTAEIRRACQSVPRCYLLQVTDLYLTHSQFWHADQQ